MDVLRWRSAIGSPVGKWGELRTNLIAMDSVLKEGGVEE